MNKYCCKAIPKEGWRIWNRKMKKWWGNPFKTFPEELIDELNGLKRPDKIVELTRKYL